MTGTQAQRTLPKVVALSALWVMFSGKLDALHLTFGAVSVALVVCTTRATRLAGTRTVRHRPVGRARWAPAITYPFWLLKEVLLANLQMAQLILDPRLPVDPVLVRFDSRLESVLAQVLLANSITLTPGTFTIDIRDRSFLVHAITEAGASGTELSAMQQRVAAVFGEDAAEVSILEVRRRHDDEPAP